jgi:hypothetical protein
VFNHPDGGGDTITDFAANDRIVIRVRAFDPQIGIDPVTKGFADPGTNFIADGAPIAAEGTFLYDSLTGVLQFDPDGTGAGFALTVATLTGAPALAAGNFLLT